MEHKFRAWDKENKCMVYQEDMNGHMINKPYWFSLSECEVELLMYDKDYKAYCRINADIMKYTGLKDENGTEIYEGDIVEVTRKHWNNCNKEYLEKTTKELGVIEFFKDLQISLKVKEEDYNLYQPLLWILEDDSEIEVIGNIYKNSELLEGNR